MTDFNWTATFGEVKTAAQWTDLGDNDRALKDGTGIDDGAILPEHLVTGAGTSWAWQSFTPTWTSSGSAPSIGNGTLSGSYIKIGRTILFRVKFVGGSTTTWGTGNYFITLPVAGYSGIAANDGFALSGYMEDSAVKGYGVIGARMLDTSKFYVIVADTAASSVGTWAATGPFTWGTGDYWSATGFYEAAS